MGAATSSSLTPTWAQWCCQLLSCFGCQQRRTTVIRTTVIMLEIFSDLRSLLHYSHVSIDSWVFRLHYR